MDPGDAKAQLKAQILVVAQMCRDLEQVLARDVEREFATVDHDVLNRLGRALAKQLFKDVNNAVEPLAIRAISGAGHLDAAHQAVVAGGVTASAEHSLAHVDQRQRFAPVLIRGAFRDGAVDPLAFSELPVLLLRAGEVAHLRSPCMSDVGVATSAAASAAAAISRRLAPSGVF